MYTNVTASNGNKGQGRKGVSFETKPQTSILSLSSLALRQNSILYMRQ